MNKYNRHPNQYSTRDPRGLYLMLATVATGVALWTYGEVKIIKSTVPFSPLGTMSVQAQEPAVEVTTEPLNTYGAPTHIVELIKKYFGDETQNALKIVGTCENGKWNPTATNHNRNGSWDAGIFQINSVHGYSQEYLFNPENNIRAAKKIFDGRGWSSWSCSHVLQIKSFWQ